MDWPGADAIAARLRRALPPGVDGDTPAPGPQQAPVDPMAQLLAAKAEAEIAKTRAEVEGKLLDNAKKGQELAEEAGGLAGPATPAAPPPVPPVVPDAGAPNAGPPNAVPPNAVLPAGPDGLDI